MIIHGRSDTVLNPGGVRNETFLKTWSDGNDALDANELAAFAQAPPPMLGAELIGPPLLAAVWSGGTRLIDNHACCPA